MEEEGNNSSFNDDIKDSIDILKEAQSKLDLGSRRCPNCGSIRYNTWADKQSSSAIGSCLTRLEALLSKR